MGFGTLGFGTSFGYPTQQTTPWGISPYGTQGLGASGLNINPFAWQQLHGQSLGTTPLASLSVNPYNLQQALPQIFQLLQAVPHQVQQLQQLEFAQQQQLQQLQQILQVIPVQLAQLQQLIQHVPQQLQQLSQLQQQPFGQISGLGGVSPWGITPQGFGAQPGHIM
jgi:small-conductance mechanosensitive channel